MEPVVKASTSPRVYGTVGEAMDSSRLWEWLQQVLSPEVVSALQAVWRDILQLLMAYKWWVVAGGALLLLLWLGMVLSHRYQERRALWRAIHTLYTQKLLGTFPILYTQLQRAGEEVALSEALLAQYRQSVAGTVAPEGFALLVAKVEAFLARTTAPEYQALQREWPYLMTKWQAAAAHV